MPHVDNLKNSSLFKSWPKDAVSALAATGSVRSLSPGESVFTEGDEATSLFLIVSGTVKIHKSAKDQAEAVTVMGAGSHFGEFGLLAQDKPSQIRFGGAEASEPTQLLEISYSSLEEMIKKDQGLGMLFYKDLAMNLARRIQKTTEDLAGLKSLRLRHV